MLPLLALVLIASGNSAENPCPGTTTVEVNACLNSRLGEADAALNRYYRAALDRLKNDKKPQAVKTLVQAERSWIAYRDAECRAADQSWSGGTIHTSMALDCQIRLTNIRTYTIWRNWLTYPDSTPALLPRPKIEDVVSDRQP